MMMKVVYKFIFLASFFAFLVKSASVICYYKGLSAKNGLVPEILDSNLCTYINYAFIDIWEDGNLKVQDENLEIEQGLFTRVTDLKDGNPNLKVLLSVGGDEANTSSLFPLITTNSIRRRKFIESAIYYILQFNFDGLDLTWKHVTSSETESYITLLRELKSTFQPRGWLLTAAVAANPTDGYDILEMQKYLDIINIMPYDSDSSWSSYINQNITLSVNNWVTAGMPTNKLAIGTSFHGRLFTLNNFNQPVSHGPITQSRTGKNVEFSTICLNYNNWTRMWDSKLKNPYKYHGNQWIGYNNQESIWEKAAWVKSLDLFGISVWTITDDDVKGQCGEEQVLLKQINKAIK